MEDRNAHFRRLHTQYVPTTDGAPDFYLSTIRMFRAAFQDGLAIASRDYNAVCEFLRGEGFGFRQIAQILDFSFDLGYADVLNAIGAIDSIGAGAELRRAEIARIEHLLEPHGLATWRREDEYGRSPDGK